MNLAIQADSRPILTVSPDDFASCPDCGRRLETDGQEMARDDDGPIYLGTCPTHGGWRWQVERVRPACPECGNEATIYARLDVQWDETEQRWELLAHASDSPLDCSECDHEFYISESDFPELPDYIAKPETLPGLAKALGQADGDVVLTIADGLDACCDGRGWDATHQAAADLANQAPALRDALAALHDAADAFAAHGKQRHYDALRAALDVAAGLLQPRVQDLGGAA